MIRSHITRLAILSMASSLLLSCKSTSPSELDPALSVVRMTEISEIQRNRRRFVSMSRKERERAETYNNLLYMSCMGCPSIDIHYLEIQEALAGNLKGGTKAVNSFVQLALIDYAGSRDECKPDLWLGTTEVDNIEVRLSRIRNEVLVGTDLWEIVEIKVFIAATDQGYRLQWIVDGRYASGIMPPVDETEYRDMQPRYEGDLRRYCSRLAAHFSNYVREWKRGKARPSVFFHQPSSWLAQRPCQ
jgi:hypothetical protein